MTLPDASPRPDLEALPAGAAPNAIAVTDDDYKMLADNVPVLAWMADADGYIFWYNRRWHAYCGTTPAEMEGWGWRSVHDPLVLPGVLAKWRACIASVQPFEMTFPLRGADGTFRPFLTRVQPVRSAPDADHPEGRVARWFGTNIDISAQAEAEAALRVERDRSHGILESMAEGFMLLDAGFRILAVNAEALRLDGRAAADLVGRLHWEAYPGSEDDEVGRLYRRALQERAPGILEHRRSRRDGGEQWLETRTYPSPGGDALAVFSRDVTERRRAQEELRESDARRRGRLLPLDRRGRRPRPSRRRRRRSLPCRRDALHCAQCRLTLVTSTFVACLEHAGRGSVRLEQEEAFKPITARAA